MAIKDIAKKKCSISTIQRLFKEYLNKPIIPPGITIQRCVVHIIRISIIYLRQRPKYLAAIELKEIVLKLSSISSHQEKDIWIKLFLDWEQKYHHFLQEKN